MRYHLLRALVVDHFLLPEPKPRRKRKAWVWPYLQKRLKYGHYDTLMDELYKENPDLYKNYTRMDRELFDSIVEAVTPIIERKTSRWRKPIDPSTRVAITLRYLATGDSYKSLQYAFRVALCGVREPTGTTVSPLPGRAGGASPVTVGGSAGAALYIRHHSFCRPCRPSRPARGRWCNDSPVPFAPVAHFAPIFPDSYAV